jgi:hypothetical protein
MTIDIIGTWRLVGTSAVDADGGALPPPYGGETAQGTVHFTGEGRMLAMLCNAAPGLSGVAAREFVSYGGDFTFDGRQLVTKVDVSSRADWMGTEQVRDASFADGVLTLRPPLRAYASVPEQRVLHWIKIADR